MRVESYRTLIVLLAAQCFGQTAAPVLVLLGGLVGTQIAPSANLATLPLAFMIIGTACTTAPASMLMARVGRKLFDPAAEAHVAQHRHICRLRRVTHRHTHTRTRTRL